MKNKFTAWIVGGLITASVLGISYGVSSAAEAETTPAKQTQMTQQEQTNCGEMMASPEMQNNMRTMMKDMMANDPEMKRIMIDMMQSEKNAR
ncbi:hypothetical protein [Anaerosinus massiliensis]|uniref:hypothetical protein n=1 Tax=Massilibacillus massiliensis TaxID=1806837 RepID=UPI000DA6298D|nr:hypothetical protein [Massilibacillus massiliensis]